MKVLVPVDGSDGANHAAHFAARLVHDAGGQVVLLHVFDHAAMALLGMHRQTRAEVEHALDLEARGSLSRARDAMQDEVCDVAERRATGDPVDEILIAADAEDCDLIVMGTRGPRAVRGIVRGSVSDRVVQRSRRPVTVVH